MIDAALQATLRAAVREDGPLVFLTGAGISAESGIPTFRGPEGYWTVGSRHYHPQELATAEAFGRMPREVWRWYLYRRAVCRAAAPNPGHLALVELERRLGDRFVLVTQNVDGLHLRAGNSSERTLQIHGNIDFMRCAAACSTALVPVPDELAARERDTPLSDATFAALRCPRCGRPARPHVLWFDEVYDEPLFRAATALGHARDAALLVVVGTAGATNLPLSIGAAVARAGRPVVDINPEANPFAELAARTGGAWLRAAAGEALPLLLPLLA
ncbi:MAG: Sir2 family NAD-dependent protein deacetylase [Nannocystaceae bacterium]